ncbi:hypothetical protein SDC9_209126 [bioreactor metagenome]|uniref:Uncharacterized protein n=1 Tax=bioreactor metagenome TaxID=1076179 RepID=A0A645JFE5_9ZZZZ
MTNITISFQFLKEYVMAMSKLHVKQVIASIHESSDSSSDATPPYLDLCFLEIRDGYNQEHHFKIDSIEVSREQRLDCPDEFDE